MILIFSGPQTAPDDLHEQNLGLGWSCEDDAPHIPVDAHGQHADVAHDLELASSEFAADLLALTCGRLAVDIAGPDSTGFKLLLDVFGMKSVDGKAKGRATNAVLEPSLYDVGHERVPIHGLLEVVDVIIAAGCTDAL